MSIVIAYVSYMPTSCHIYNSPGIQHDSAEDGNPLNNRKKLETCYMSAIPTVRADVWWRGIARLDTVVYVEGSTKKT